MKKITVEIIAKSLTTIKIGGYMVKFNWNGNVKTLTHSEPNIGNDRIYNRAIDCIMNTLKEPVELDILLLGSDIRLSYIIDYVNSLNTSHIITVRLYTPNKQTMTEFFNMIYPNGKECPQCKTVFNINKYQYSNPMMGFTKLCKKCNSANVTIANTIRDYLNPENMIKYVIFPNMKHSNIVRNKRRPDRNLQFGFTDAYDLIQHLIDINQWNKFCELFDVYKDSDRDVYKAPSIDRINNDIGYCKGNLRVITYIENTRAKLTHGSENTTLLGKLYNKAHYIPNYNGWQVGRTYIIDGVYKYWRSIYPTEKMALNASKQALDNILECNLPLLKEIRISDWKTMWPDLYTDRIKKNIKKRKVNGHIRKISTGYRLQVKTLDGGTVVSILPTRKLAEELGLKHQLMVADGKTPTSMVSRDWIKYGYSDTVPFKKYQGRGDNYTIKYTYKGKMFSAYITDASWQLKFANDLIVDDLRNNGKLTVKSIRKNDWYNIKNKTNTVEFTKHINKHSYTLICKDNDTTFSAFIDDPEWQDDFVRQLIHDDIKANGKITVPSIRKLSWDRELFTLKK